MSRVTASTDDRHNVQRTVKANLSNTTMRNHTANVHTKYLLLIFRKGMTV